MPTEGGPPRRPALLGRTSSLPARAMVAVTIVAACIVAWELVLRNTVLGPIGSRAMGISGTAADAAGAGAGVASQQLRESLYVFVGTFARTALTATGALFLLVKSDAYVSALGFGYAEDVVLWAIVRVAAGRWNEVAGWATSTSLDVQLAGSVVAFSLWHFLLVAVWRNSPAAAAAAAAAAAPAAASSEESARRGVMLTRWNWLAGDMRDVFERVFTASAVGNSMTRERLTYATLVLAAVIWASMKRVVDHPITSLGEAVVHASLGLVSGGRRAINMHHAIRCNAREIGDAPPWRRFYLRLWILGADGRGDFLGET